MANNPISVELSSSVNPQDVPKILISAPGYESKEITPYKGDGTAKTDLGVISLNPITKGLEQDKLKASQLTKSQIEELSISKRDFKYFSQEKLTNQINTLKSVLIPTILTLIAGFGITKATELAMENKDKILEGIKNKSICPPQTQLLDIINKKNKLVKQLKNSLKIINSTTKALGIAGGTIEGLSIAYNVLKNLQIPVSTGVPGVPGLLTNVILAIQDNKDRLDKLITNLKTINTSTLTVLVLLRQVLLQAIQLLNLLDSLIQDCYPDAEQEQLSKELTALTNQQSQQLSPVVTNVNGFEMGVETEPTISTLSVKRRRAIAKNKQGIIMLKGEWSFSSIDQILIDELVFYIETNDLRAD
jgi:hypothetical protein